MTLEEATGSVELEPEVIQQLLETTQFNKQQLMDMYKEFLQNFPSGYISFEEFLKVLSPYFPSQGSPSNILNTFSMPLIQIMMDR